MRTNNPIRSLFTLTYFATRGNVVTSLLGILAMGLAFLATQQELLYGMFMITAVINLPIQMLSGMGGNEGRWERFQITLPIKRSDLLKVQYASVIMAAIVGGAIYTLGVGISTNIHDEMFNYGFASAIASNVHIYGMALLAIGMIFILQPILGKLSAIIAFTIPGLTGVLVPVAADRFGISVYVLSAIVLAVSVVIFIISYSVTKASYNKADF